MTEKKMSKEAAIEILEDALKRNEEWAEIGRMMLDLAKKDLAEKQSREEAPKK